MSISSSPPPSASPVSPCASAINSLVQEWRHQQGLSARGTSFHYDLPTPHHAPTTSSVPYPRVPSPPPPLPPPRPRPDAPQPQHQSVSKSTPKISISDWQPEEESPALCVFLKNAVPHPRPLSPQTPTPRSTQHRGSGDDDDDDDDDDDEGSSLIKRDAKPRLLRLVEERFWQGNGRMRTVLDILLDEIATAVADDAERAGYFEKKRKRLGIMLVRKI